MKKRITALALAALMLLGLAACGKEAPAAETPPPTLVEAAPAAPETPEPTETPVPTLPPVEQRPQEDPTASGWADLYRRFLNDNFTTLSSTCAVYLAGVGFVDLDLDTVPELLVFDAGVGSTMGVQFFDIIDGQVECISAASPDVGTAFGGEHFDARHYVNTNQFTNFRLKEAADGSLYFAVNSFNGSEELQYSEYFRFGQENGVLKLESVCYRQSGMDPETMAPTYTVYSVDDTTLTEAEYNARMQLEETAADLGYDATGLFRDNYSPDLQGFTELVEDAIALYVPAL